MRSITIFLIVNLATGVACASNRAFEPGDAFFFGSLDNSYKEQAIAGNIYLDYAFDPLRLMACGYHGATSLEIIRPPKTLTAFLDWSLAQKASQPADLKARRPRPPRAFFLIYPKGYDLDTYGLFLRYNEKPPKSNHGDGGGLLLSETRYLEKNAKLASKVPPIDLMASEKRAYAVNINEFDVYFLDRSMAPEVIARMEQHKIKRDKAKAAGKLGKDVPFDTSSLSYFADYHNGKKGLSLYRLRDGAMHRLIHTGDSWGTGKPITIPTSDKP
jgi:hypothetical protein